MIYVDMHADSLTVCSDSGLGFEEYEGQISFQKLKKSSCAAQCFAIFTDGDNAAFNFEKYIEFYAQRKCEFDRRDGSGILYL